MDRLQRLGYVSLVEPLAPTAHRAWAQWRIHDPYLRLWFRRIFPNRSRIGMGRLDDVRREIEADLDAFVGQVFEDCCRDWFARYCALPEASTAARVGQWWSRDGQQEIDLVALDRRHRYVFLGSCKWHRGQVGHAALDDLHRMRSLLAGPASGAKLGLFARRSFSASVRERARREDVLLVTTGELF